MDFIHWLKAQKKYALTPKGMRVKLREKPR